MCIFKKNLHLSKFIILSALYGDFTGLIYLERQSGNFLYFEVIKILSLQEII